MNGRRLPLTTRPAPAGRATRSTPSAERAPCPSPARSPTSPSTPPTPPATRSTSLRRPRRLPPRLALQRDHLAAAKRPGRRSRRQPARRPAQRHRRRSRQPDPPLRRRRHRRLALDRRRARPGQPFSEGLPDAAVLDLELHHGRRLLRAATHGRSVFERAARTPPRAGVELYVRDTQLDHGRFTTVNGLSDPTRPGETVRHWRGPDIKVDTPNAMGQYQFADHRSIDFFQFVDTLERRLPATSPRHDRRPTITTRVYVQVHNRGVTPANGVRVMLLLANASAGLPPLPSGYTASVQSGTPITAANWQTVGIADPERPAGRLPARSPRSTSPPTSCRRPPCLTGNDHHCVLALRPPPDDQFTATTEVDRRPEPERAQGGPQEPQGRAVHRHATLDRGGADRRPDSSQQPVPRRNC